MVQGNLRCNHRAPVTALRLSRAGSAGTALKKARQVQRWPYKLMYYWGYQNIPDLGVQLEMYDLENDPEELEELSKVKPDIAKELEAEIKEEMKKSGKITVPD